MARTLVKMAISVLSPRHRAACYPALMSRDLRRHRRLRVDARADILGTEVILGARVTDLSMGGCGIEGPVYTEPQVPLGLVLEFPKQKRIVTLLAEVVRTRPEGAGLRFVEVTEAQRKALRRTIHGTRTGS